MNTEATHDQNIPLSTGVRLRSAREQLGLSQQTVAKRLCLKVSTVRDIEEDRAPDDLALTFLRGYIRSYAKLVHIPENEVLPIIQGVDRDTVKTIKVTSLQNLKLKKYRKKHNHWLMSFICLVLFLLISLTGAWWWQNYEAQQKVKITSTKRSYTELNKSNNGTQSLLSNNNCRTSFTTKLQTPIINRYPDTITAPLTSLQKQESTQELIQDQNNTVPLDSINVIDKTPTSSTTNNTEQSLLPNQIVTASRMNDPNSLKMKFTADCWLEVNDATGRKLFSGLQRKDGNLLLTGQTPYKIIIGAPAAVQIQFSGKPVDLSHFVRTNQIAHLTLHANN